MDTEGIGRRVREVREYFSLTRKAFAARLGCQEIEIANIEYCKLKKPEQKESLYRNIASEFGVSLDWLKNGGDEKDMFGASEQDEITSAFGELAARKDPMINGFIDFLRSRTPEQLDFISQQLQECAEAIKAANKQKKED